MNEQIKKRINNIKKISQMAGIKNPYLNINLIEKAEQLKQFFDSISHLPIEEKSLEKTLETLKTLNREADPNFVKSMTKSIDDTVLLLKKNIGNLK